jgi:hypothetical protein
VTHTVSPKTARRLLATTLGWRLALPAAVACAALAPTGAQAAWQNNFSGFGATLQGDLYTPSAVAASPGSVDRRWSISLLQ